MNTCKQCNLDNHAGCTGRLYASQDSPLCQCTCEYAPKPPKNRTKAEVLPELTEKILEYMRAGTTDDSPMFMSGFILKAVANRLSDAPDVVGTSIWAHAEGQSIYMTMGLQEALAMDVGDYYAAMYAERQDIQDEDGDE